MPGKLSQMIPGLNNVQRIAITGIFGAGGSGMAVISASLSDVNHVASLVGSLLGIAVSVISLCKILMHQDQAKPQNPIVVPVVAAPAPAPAPAPVQEVVQEAVQAAVKEVVHAVTTAVEPTK